MTPVYMDPMAGKIGEYVGVTAYYDKINAVWTDSRDGNSEIYTANWYLPLLEPRLFEPSANSYQLPSPGFRWSTAWKHDQDRYRVEISMDDQFGTGIISRIVDTNFLVLDTALDDGVHYWRVKALTTDGQDSSEYSAVWSFEADGTAPDVPDLLSPEDGMVTNNPTPSFDWTTSTRAGTPVTYDLHISTDSTFPAGPSTRVYADLTTSEYTPTDSLVEDSVSYWRVVAEDAVGNSSQSTTFTVTYIAYICGDINDSGGNPNVSDLTYLVDYLFRGGPAPPILEAADVDGNGRLNVADLTYLVSYLFRGGPDPVC